MRVLIFIAAIALFGFSLPAHADLVKYEMIKNKSSLKFFAIGNNVPVEGKFNEFTADIQFDSKNTEKSKITVEVNTSSVEVRVGEAQNSIKLPQWLSVEAFPKAVFTTKTITRMPMSDNYYAEGDLTLRNKTVPIILNFQLDDSNKNVAIAKGYATVHRTDFGVGQGSWATDDVVKNEVRIEFRIVASKL